MRFDQQFMDSMAGRQNVYSADEMKVDCCLLSHNNSYVVTGSSSGPPQVWDMHVSSTLLRISTSHRTVV
ncbi:unnamed protein product [Protopolystoma xenopodis]|uniref:Uncharacterized protein n=1 Tax=Protopolystoma xenopodis TaxID=117903 RepID=A0A448XA85_9PLAT|nr:unnamed protein product [Protopolystoma xenopodis]